jgi:hypothetical protein
VETTGGLDPGGDADGELPFIDEHAVSIPRSREVVWTALQRYVVTSLFVPDGSPMAAILGTEPRAGFRISESTAAERLTLVGRHRFSRYRLAFELGQAHDGDTELRARTYAVFPGVTGRVYRTLVIGTRFHVIATGRILRSVRRLSLAPTRPEAPTA